MRKITTWVNVFISFNWQKKPPTLSLVSVSERKKNISTDYCFWACHCLEKWAFKKDRNPGPILWRQKSNYTWHYILLDMNNMSFSFDVQNFNTVQKMKFPVKDFFSKCDQICGKLRIWSHLLKKSLLENFIFCAV